MAREELGGFNLGDERLSRRAHFVTERLARSPGFSLPDAFPTDSELEGTYRLLRNDAVKPEEMLAPHRRQTVARAAAASGTLIAIHDSTEFKFSGEYMREGLAEERIEQLGERTQRSGPGVGELLGGRRKAHQIDEEPDAV